MRIVLSSNRWIVHLERHIHISKNILTLILTCYHTLLLSYVRISLRCRLSSRCVVLVLIIVIFNLLRKLKSTISTPILFIWHHISTSKLNVNTFMLLTHNALPKISGHLYFSILSKAPCLSINYFLQILLVLVLKLLRNRL